MNAPEASKAALIENTTSGSSSTKNILVMSDEELLPLRFDDWFVVILELYDILI